MELGITTSPTPERYTVHVAGEVDISNADALRTAIDLALEQPPAEVELDFSQVSYIHTTGIGEHVGAEQQERHTQKGIDNTGIGVLVGAAHHARDHQKSFAITGAQMGVMRVAQLLGVDKEIGMSAA